jgi:tRNA(Phe) wybutosine-synthesizing methylase Tyw3
MEQVEVTKEKKRKKKAGHQVEQLPEPRDEFCRERARVLEALKSEERDKSRAGGVDEDIASFVSTVNEKRHLYTASSCAGRLIVTLNEDAPSGYAVPWLFVSHKYVLDTPLMMQQVREGIDQLPQRDNDDFSVWFKLEPPIVAVVCSSEAAATKVMNIARGAAGIKRCFVISMRGDQGCVVSVSDTKRVECVMWQGKEQLVSERYMEATVEIANKKLAESRAKMEKLRKAIEESDLL